MDSQTKITKKQKDKEKQREHTTDSEEEQSQKSLKKHSTKKKAIQKEHPSDSEAEEHNLKSLKKHKSTAQPTGVSKEWLKKTQEQRNVDVVKVTSELMKVHKAIDTLNKNILNTQEEERKSRESLLKNIRRL